MIVCLVSSAAQGHRHVCRDVQVPERAARDGRHEPRRRLRLRPAHRGLRREGHGKRQERADEHRGARDQRRPPHAPRRVELPSEVRQGLIDR